MKEITLFAGLVPAGSETAEKSPCLKYEDMAIVLKTRIEDSSFGTFSNSSLDMLKQLSGKQVNITDKTFESALKISAIRFPAVIRPADDEENLFGLESRYILFNGMPGGAVAFLYPGVLKEIYNMLGDFWMLPYSTEFVVIVPDNENNNRIVEQLEKSFPALEVEDDFLSKTIFHYDVRSGELFTKELWDIAQYLRKLGSFE